MGDTADSLATESGWPAYGLNGAPLVRCNRCGSIHYCSPSDRDRTGLLCFTCSSATLPQHCVCGEASCPSCGPRIVPKPRTKRLRVRSW